MAHCPHRGVYGVPEQWPHIAGLYRDAGFTPSHRESVYLVDIAAIAAPRSTPDQVVSIRRSVGINGVRFTATSDNTPLGYIEVERVTGPDRARDRPWPTSATSGSATATSATVATLLLQHAAAWLRLGLVDLLLAYASPDTQSDGPMRAFLTSNELPWSRRPSTAGHEPRGSPTTTRKPPDGAQCCYRRNTQATRRTSRPRCRRRQREQAGIADISTPTSANLVARYACDRLLLAYGRFLLDTYTLTATTNFVDTSQVNYSARST